MVINLFAITPLFAHEYEAVDFMEGRSNEDVEDRKWYPLVHTVHELKECPAMPDIKHGSCTYSKKARVFNCSHSVCGIMGVTLPKK